MREIRLSGLMQGREPVGGLSVYRLLPTLPSLRRHLYEIVGPMAAD